MSSIVIQDLTRSRALDTHAMSAIRGGQAFGPNVNVNLNLDQRIAQVQEITAVERIADALHALDGRARRPRDARGLGRRLQGLGLDIRLFFADALALARLDCLRDAALDVAVDLGRQRRAAVRVVQGLEQARDALGRVRQQAVDARQHLGLPEGAALELAKGVGEAVHVFL